MDETSQPCDSSESLIVQATDSLKIPSVANLKSAVIFAVVDYFGTEPNRFFIESTRLKGLFFSCFI